MRHFLRSESLSTSQYNGPLSLKTKCFPFISSTWDMRKIIKMKCKHWRGFKRATSDTLRMLLREEWLTSFVVRKMEFALWQSYTFRCAGRRLRIALVDANAILLNSGPFLRSCDGPFEYLCIFDIPPPPPLFVTERQVIRTTTVFEKSFSNHLRMIKNSIKYVQTKDIVNIYTRRLLL